MNFKGKKLVLGAGMENMSGWVHHDLNYHASHIDCAWNLNVFPYPWKDNMFIEVRAMDVIEHLNETLEVMNEIHRICQDLAICTIKVPMLDNPNRWADPTHKRAFMEESFDYFDPRTDFGSRYGFYTDKKWKILDKQFTEAPSMIISMKVVK